MEKIASFTIDHTKLLPGIYVSRKDHFQNVTLTTFDIRLTRPNFDPVINTAELHTIEHLGATFLRNHSQWKERLVYFGPMGCRTGLYVIFEGDLISQDVISIITDLFKFISTFSSDIPGASAQDCGNFHDMNLPMARYVAKHFLTTVLLKLSDENLNYPS